MAIERVLNIKFNKKQKASSTSIRWLLNDTSRQRQGGRTTLILSLLIEKALKNPGTPVIIFDHYDLSWGARHSYKRHIVHTLREMLKNSRISPQRITIDDYNFTLTIK